VSKPTPTVLIPYTPLKLSSVHMSFRRNSVARDSCLGFRPLIVDPQRCSGLQPAAIASRLPLQTLQSSRKVRIESNQKTRAARLCRFLTVLTFGLGRRSVTPSRGEA
jgi:hypothetical protein